MDLVILRSRAVWEPNADVVIDDEARSLVVRVELAGADSESLRVFVDERDLFISGRRADTARLRRGSFLQKEIADGEFVKKIALPVGVQYGEVTATYADGMLTIALPVAAPEYLPASRTEIRMIVKRILA
ncbi:MAG TPA: Hsp20/alpha crystallin family protein [Candidatus Baltobacteraceae bacterium]|jgi:HSP20 family molecular chaperone IbpA|nr:Hsp20/alpha crystallin family protein [Candidatus Baltobacteraceae bacterium]